MDLDTFDFDILDKMDDAWTEHEWGDIKAMHMSSDMCKRYTEVMAVKIWVCDHADATQGGTLYAGTPVVECLDWAPGTVKAVL